MVCGCSRHLYYYCLIPFCTIANCFLCTVLFCSCLFGSVLFWPIASYMSLHRAVVYNAEVPVRVGASYPYVQCSHVPWSCLNVWQPPYCVSTVLFLIYIVFDLEYVISLPIHCSLFELAFFTVWFYVCWCSYCNAPS